MRIAISSARLYLRAILLSVYIMRLGLLGLLGLDLGVNVLPRVNPCKTAVHFHIVAPCHSFRSAFMFCKFGWMSMVSGFGVWATY